MPLFEGMNMDEHPAFILVFARTIWVFTTGCRGFDTYPSSLLRTDMETTWFWLKWWNWLHGPNRVSILNFRSCPYGRIASHGWPDLFWKNYRTTDCSWFFGSVRSEFQQACAQSVWVVGDFEFPLAIPVRSVDPSLWRIFSWFVVTQTDKRSLTSIQTVNWIFVALHPWWKESTSNLSIYHRLLGLRSWLAP